MTTLSELEALAKAATPGPWKYVANGIIYSYANPETVVLWDDDGRNRVNDYPLIAAANPQTILAMIALIRQMEAALTYYDFGTGVPQRALNALKEFDK